MEPYNLYYTFNTNLSRKRFAACRRKALSKKVKTLQDTGKEALIMLICEHARLNDDFVYSPDSETLPYGGIQKGEDVVFEFKKLPHQLCWILSKFLEVACK